MITEKCVYNSLKLGHKQFGKIREIDGNTPLQKKMMKHTVLYVLRNNST